MTETTAVTPGLAAVTQVAIETFRVHERHRLLADKSERDVNLAAARMGMATEPGDYDRAEYLRQTTEIIAEYEVKREKAGLT